MDGRYGSLADQRSILETNKQDRIQNKPKALKLGWTFLILLIVLIVVIILGIIYWRIAPNTVFSRNLINASSDDSNGGINQDTNVGDGSDGSICVADSDCGVGFECSNDECCFFGEPIITNVQTILGNPSNIVVTYEFGTTFRPGTVVEVVLETPSGIQVANKVEVATGTTTIQESDFTTPVAVIFPNTIYRVKLRVTYTCGARNNFTSVFTPPFSFNTPSCGANPGNIVGYSTQFGTFNGFVGTAAEASGLLSIPTNFIVSSSPGLHPNLADTLYPNTVLTFATSPSFFIYYRLPFLAGFGQTVYVRSYASGSFNGCASNLDLERSYTV